MYILLYVYKKNVLPVLNCNFPSDPNIKLLRHATLSITNIRNIKSFKYSTYFVFQNVNDFR